MIFLPFAPEPGEVHDNEAQDRIRIPGTPSSSSVRPASCDLDLRGPPGLETMNVSRPVVVRQDTNLEPIGTEDRRHPVSIVT